MRSKIIAVFIALAIPFSVYADVQIDAFRSLLASDKPTALQLIEAVGAAYGWANAALSQDGKEVLFCVAAKKKFDGTELIQVLDVEYEKFEAEYKNANASQIELVLLQGLRRTYPCVQKQP
jgi:hypothetical protein